MLANSTQSCCLPAGRQRSVKKPSPAKETPHFQSKSSALCLVVSMFIATVACLNWHDQYREICWFTMGKTIAHTPK